MLLIGMWAVGAIGVLGFVAWRVKRSRERRELDEHSIEAEELHMLLEPQPRVLVYDVRQPLDLLAYSEMIPGAKRVPPKNVLANPSLIPREEDVVVYCTCPGEKTSWEILRRAKELKYSRLKLLRGGLEAWKAKGYAVVPYKDSFRLDTAV
jgi:rhodanese-related sulfurtransferase